MTGCYKAYTMAPHSSRCCGFHPCAQQQDAAQSALEPHIAHAAGLAAHKRRMVVRACATVSAAVHLHDLWTVHARCCR